MARSPSPEDFKDGLAITNRTILSLCGLGALYNLLVGNLFSRLLSEAMIVSLSETWLIGKPITELLIYSPTSIGYYLASLTGIILFFPFYFYAFYARYAPTENRSAIGKTITPRRYFAMMLFFLWWVAETLFLGSLEDYRGQLRDLSRFLFFPIFPMFSTLLNMVFPICAFWFYALWARPRKAAAS